MPGADGGLHAHEAASAGRAKEFTEDGGMGDVGRWLYIKCASNGFALIVS